MIIFKILFIMCMLLVLWGLLVAFIGYAVILVRWVIHIIAGVRHGDDPKHNRED